MKINDINVLLICSAIILLSIANLIQGCSIYNHQSRIQILEQK